MNINKIQRELFNAFIGRGTRPSIFKCDNIELYTSDGYKGYVLRRTDIVFDRDKFKLSEYTVPQKGDDDILLKPTRAAMISGNSITQRYDGGKFAVYLNPVYLKCFDNPQLYGNNPLNRILVYEKNQFVGVVLPVRCKGEELFNKVIEESSKDNF